MADRSESNGTSSGSAQQPPGPPDAPGFSIGNVLKVLLPLVLLVGGVFVFVAFFDGLNRLSNITKPALVSATGQVMYQGQPLEGAVVSTRPTGGQMHGATGWTDAEGRFTLRTDINGYVDGAYAGEHQVAVTGYALMSSAAAAPPLITPQMYASLETTPLRITVSPVAEENKFVLTLEGDPPERRGANSGGGGGPPGRGGGGFDPEAIVRRVFDEYDKDDDEQLTAEEMEPIEGNRAERIRGADANEDGVVGRDELLEAFSAPRQPE